MQILLIDAFEPDDPDRGIVEATVAQLESQGHTVDTHHLISERFRVSMTTAEHIAYETEDPLQSADTRRAAEAVRAADALVICHHTTMYGLAPVLKGWLDRVLVFGVAFEFNDVGRVTPGLRNVRRIGVVSTTHHGRLRTWRRGDLAHRTLGRTLWLSCNRRCRLTFVRIPVGRSVGDGRRAIGRGFRRWR